MSPSSAVLPAFRRTHRKSGWFYMCRQCIWSWRAQAGSTRDQRMIVLSQHLTDMHGKVWPSSQPKEIA